MKKLTASLLVLSSTLFAGTITVDISSIKPKLKGELIVGLYTPSNKFRDTKDTYKNLTIKNPNSTETIMFTDVPDGTYAIAFLHDKNSNFKLDTNIFGIPKEGYGFSNNIFHSLKPTKFNEAKFKLVSNKKLTLSIRY